MSGFAIDCHFKPPVNGAVCLDAPNHYMSELTLKNTVNSCTSLPTMKRMKTRAMP